MTKKEVEIHNNSKEKFRRYTFIRPPISAFAF